MKIIFIKETQGVAKKNQIKEVAKGYALNYLLPKKIAIIATKEKIAEIHLKEKKQESKIKESKTVLDELSDKIQKLKLEIRAKANEEGHLFGGISNEDISKILKEKHDLEIDKNAIDLPHHLKKTGKHKVLIKLSPNQKIYLTIMIKAE